MKIYIDFKNQVITKTSNENVMLGDIYSNVFELLFYNFGTDTNWFPTLSQLAPNGRSAGDFSADALGIGETHNYTEDGVNYLKYDFTIGDGYVNMSGRSMFYIWVNRTTPVMSRKGIAKVNVNIDASTDTPFITDPLFNPKVKNYIDAQIEIQNQAIAAIGQGQPSYLAPAATIEIQTENKGLAVATDTGIIYVWDTTLSTPAYVSSGLQYSQWPTAVYHSGSQLQDSNGNAFYPNIADECVTQEKLDDDLFDDLLLKETTDITSSFTLQNRYLDKANGNANPDANSRCTDFIDLSQYGEFFISGFSQYATCMICTYDENQQFLRYYCDGGSAGVTYTDYDFIPQSDEKYAKFGTYQYTTHPLIIKSVEVIGKAENKTPNYLYKKKYVACGDSFTKGDVIASNKVYPYLIAERNNMTLVNMSANGSYAHNGADGFTNSSNSYYYQNIPLDADYITIAYGLNETSTTIGTKDSTDNTTIWGAYNEILTWIITNIPNAKVGIISNDAWMTYELRNALQEIASYYGVSFLDLKEYGKPMMISGKYTEDGDVNSTIKNLRTNQYCVSNLNGHPNELGHRVRSYIIENFLRGMGATDNRYTKKEVETKLNLKADKSTTYTKTEVDTALGLKANASTTYSKTETDSAIATAVSNCKGYTDAKLEALKWELGSHTLDVTTDTDVKYLKNVPSGAIGCQINKVGGMSYKSENLLNIADVSETTTNGITYKVENGVITLNGTASAETSISFNISLSLSGTYTLSAFNTFTIANSLFLITTEGNKSVSLNATNKSNSFNFSSATASQLIIWIPSSTVFSNDMFSPMLVSGSTSPTSYKPYFSGIRNSAVTSVVSKGANLLQLSDVPTTTTLSGITYSVSNNTIKISGTATYGGSYDFVTNNLSSDTYSCLINFVRGNQASSTEPSIYIRNSDNSYVDYFAPNKLTSTFTNSVGYIRVSWNNGSVLDLEFNFMLVNGSTAPSVFKPYIAPTTKSIPAQIQALDGYGWGVNSTCYNYIDLDRKVFVQKVGRVDLGSKTYTKLDNDNRVRYYFNKTGLGIKDGTFNTLLDANYVQKTPADAFNDNSGWYNGTTAIGFYNNVITTEADFKTSMSGVYLYYELATPVETDISSYITDDDKYIDVEPSGTITFDNTYSQDVPSDIDYLIEEVKA